MKHRRTFFVRHYHQPAVWSWLILDTHFHPWKYYLNVYLCLALEIFHSVAFLVLFFCLLLGMRRETIFFVVLFFRMRCIFGTWLWNFNEIWSWKKACLCSCSIFVLTLNFKFYDKMKQNEIWRKFLNFFLTQRDIFGYCSCFWHIPKQCMFLAGFSAFFETSNLRYEKF